MWKLLHIHLVYDNGKSSSCNTAISYIQSLILTEKKKHNKSLQISFLDCYILYSEAEGIGGICQGKFGKVDHHALYSICCIYMSEQQSKYV